jgi:hypothetical protein
VTERSRNDRIPSGGNRDEEDEKAQQYENDLLPDKELGEDIDWEEVKQLLDAFSTTRARDAAAKLREVFGVDMGYDQGPDRSIAWLRATGLHRLHRCSSTAFHTRSA